MLYRLRPPADLTWSDVPSGEALRLAAEHRVDLDRLEWRPTESRAYSKDLLRIALRYGVTSGTGIVLDAAYTTDLGRADEIRLAQQAADEAQAVIRARDGDGWSA